MRKKVILVDDDELALSIMKYQLKRYPDIKVEDVFTNPFDALKKIKVSNPDVVFLDIDMPQLKGMDVASRIMEINQDTKIVFVTSHTQYALDAFELNAIDYLIKPVSKKRLEKTIQRLFKKKSVVVPQNLTTKSLEINCLGPFQIKWTEDAPLKWRSAITRELVAFLIHYKDSNMSKDRILDELWPEDNMKTTVPRLYSGIHYIRKSLEDYHIKKEFIELGGKYCIRLGSGVKTDATLFEEAVAAIDAHTDINTIEAIQAMYKGEYLEGEAWLWAYPERERMTNLYTEIIIKLAQKYIAALLFEKAEIILMKAFKKNTYDEKITSLLLHVYKTTNKKTKAAKHFTNYEKLLKEELSINPQENIKLLYASIK